MAVSAGRGAGTRLIAGFVAGALAVLVFHQATILVLGLFGVVPAGLAWSFRLNAWGVPVLINGMFWGGLWGCVYALLRDRLPKPLWFGGLVFGVVGPALVGVWIVVALIKGNPLLAGFVPFRLLVGAVIHGMFGIGVAVFFDQIDRRL